MFRTILDVLFKFYVKRDAQYQKAHTRVTLLEQQVALLKEKLTDPKAVVEACFAKGVEWFDYDELPAGDKQKYYDQARYILNSDVFLNETNFLKATGAQKIILDGDYQNGSRIIRDFQMTVNGYELLKERLEEIKPPAKQETQTKLNDAI